MKRIAMLALLLGLLAGCGAEQEASALPEEMPADFEIRYEDWIDADAINIYDTGEKLTSENLTTDGTQVGVAPLREYEITFTANGTTYTVTGDSTAQSYIRQDGRAAQFWEFTQYMNELYHNSPEYQSLPEAQGGYM